MKKLQCELCGSNELIKKDGYFVCEYCGTKYTTEEARKLIVEGNIDVSGSVVKIDQSTAKDLGYEMEKGRELAQREILSQAARSYLNIKSIQFFLYTIVFLFLWIFTRVYLFAIPMFICIAIGLWLRKK